MSHQAIQASLWPGENIEVRRMGGFGERMQREREMRSISLEEIAESTKIGCRMLRALEEEDFDKLPGGIFNKGFVRAYAKFLGIDEEQAVNDFQTAVMEKQQKAGNNGNNPLTQTETLNNVYASAEGTSEPDQAAGFMRAAVIIICLVGVAGLGWKYLGNRAPSTQDTSNTTQTTIAPSTAQAAAPSVTPSQTVSEPKDVAAKTDDVVKDTPSATKSEAGVDGKSVTSAPVDDAAFAAGAFRLQVRARERSWIKVTGDDGKLLMQGEIAENSSRSFRAAKQMVLTLGNAPGVEISYNGKALPQFPADQKMKTLTFTPEGLQQ